mgnify:CR=1 FL=1
MEFFEWSVSPILISFGSLSIHWYGVLFATAILSGFGVMNKIYKNENKSIEQLESLQLYMVIGIVVGARLGHCLFYDPAYYLANPLKILAINEGGLASHGGGVGAILATLYYAKKNKVSFLYLLDRLAIPTAIPVRNKMSGPGSCLESSTAMMAIAGATPRRTFFLIVIVSLVDFLFMHT